jgi:DNA-directed RNA polymerase specialized sigma24 family protein
MRLVVKLGKLETTLKRRPTRKEAAAALGVSLARAGEVTHLRESFLQRGNRHESLHDGHHHPYVADPNEAPYWVIDALKRLCADDFDAFWQVTFRTTSIEELAASKGVSRQAMSKRLEKCRRAVRSSAEADRLSAWLAQQ